MLVAETFPCPCCQQTVQAHSPDALVDELDLPPHEEAILRTVCRGSGFPVKTAQIMEVMFADDENGGPALSQMTQMFNLALRGLRERLEGTSVAVERAYYKKGYRLVIGGNDGPSA